MYVVGGMLCNECIFNLSFFSVFFQPFTWHRGGSSCVYVDGGMLCNDCIFNLYFCSVFFQPFTWHRGGSSCVYVDGGMLCNFPLFVYDGMIVFLLSVTTSAKSH